MQDVVACFPSGPQHCNWVSDYPLKSKDALKGYQNPSTAFFENIWEDDFVFFPYDSFLIK